VSRSQCSEDARKDSTVNLLVLVEFRPIQSDQLGHPRPLISVRKVGMRNWMGKRGRHAGMVDGGGEEEEKKSDEL